MNNRLKKYNLIIFLIFILLLLFSNNVNADSDTFEYNGETLNVAYFDDIISSFLIYDNVDNCYCTFHFYRTGLGLGTNPRFYIVDEDDDYITICGLSDGWLYNAITVYNYSPSEGTLNTVKSALNFNFEPYKIDKTRYSFVYKSSKTKIYDDEACTIENTTSDFFYGNGLKSPFHVEYREETKSFFVCTDFKDFVTTAYTYTGYYNKKGLQLAFFWDTYENYDWARMAQEMSSYYNEDGSNDWRYAQEILKYGEYYFCWRNHDTKTHDIYCIKITKDCSTVQRYNDDTLEWDELEKKNYEYDNYLSSDDSNAESQNFYVKYEDGSATIFSNYMQEDDAYYYDCLYSKDYINYSDDITKEYSDTQIEGYSNFCRFVKDVYENGTYYFRLRKIDKTNGSILSSNIYTIVVDGIVFNNVGENDTIDFYANTNTMLYFRKTLGIVFYPFDMMFDFFERLENLQVQEPRITVPTIKEPFTDTVFIEGFSFSLNDVLEDSNIAYVYNIYLYFVDFILYSLLFGFFMKIFKTYAHFDGGVS